METTVDDRLAAEAFVINLGEFEGPLDLLLNLARTQKVDLREISIRTLAEQYLRFVETARDLRLELAADYLVMAAWLAFLKSRLLLPPEPEAEGPDAETLAAELALRLERLEAMREAGAKLMARDRLGRERFARGAPEAEMRETHVTYTANLVDLMQAYARLRRADDFRPYAIDRTDLYTMEEALERLRDIVGRAVDWTDIVRFLPEDWTTGARRRSATAATFAASLELVKRGVAEVRQDAPMAPLRLRARR